MFNVTHFTGFFLIFIEISPSLIGLHWMLQGWRILPSFDWTVPGFTEISRFSRLFGVSLDVVWFVSEQCRVLLGFATAPTD